MSKRHPLADQLKLFAESPDDYQWQAIGASPSGWFDKTFEAAMEVCSQRGANLVRLIRKRSMIPADRLPEGWEVERNPAGTYFVKSPKFHGYVESERTTHNDAPSAALHQFLRHIDPEIGDE